MKRISEELGTAGVSCVGIYTGERKAQYDDVHVFPVLDFLKALWN